MARQSDTYPICAASSHFLAAIDTDPDLVVGRDVPAYSAPRPQAGIASGSPFHAVSPDSVLSSSKRPGIETSPAQSPSAMVARTEFSRPRYQLAGKFTLTMRAPCSLGLLWQTSAMIKERRRTPRFETLKAAQVVCSDGTEAQCIVRNLSEAGVCILVDSHVSLPRIFSLICNSLEHHKRCRFVWRQHVRLGAMFLSSVESA